MAIEKITVPDFGDVQEITVLEVYVSAGDAVEEETPLVSLESEKAVMDIPSPLAGIITEVHLAEGDTVKSDDLIALLETAGKAEEKGPEPAPLEKEADAEPPAEPASDDEPEPGSSHATPSVRAYAREKNVDLSRLVNFYCFYV